ncbi:BMC domain-containing protein [Vagococcus intermedius]|uniref:BMC domain-containing protein n=1 Tax=Vagococcus intermedius TaxID=2991418 RepID=A0AAF0I6J5_9ENTE|nr:BMC domain-containing protein [Vagococcus intermedius]WEG72779.1 BMC domain-containing protein [Vagococcus intermedius]WEG74864.1 BMC domain-containing protein [Vagococcus intermedius]
MKIQALGLIEVNGLLGGIAAADAALKTADVDLISAEKVNGGLTTIHLSGDVAAIQVAVEAGSVVARDLNCLRSSHVIPRLASETSDMVIAGIKTATPAITPEKPKPVVKKEEVKIQEPEVKQTKATTEPSVVAEKATDDKVKTEKSVKVDKVDKEDVKAAKPAKKTSTKSKKKK